MSAVLQFKHVRQWVRCCTGLWFYQMQLIGNWLFRYIYLFSVIISHIENTSLDLRSELRQFLYTLSCRKCDECNGENKPLHLEYMIARGALPELHGFRHPTMFRRISLHEPRHYKTNEMTVRPAKTQISLGIRPDWSESSLCAQWVAKDPMFLHADSEDSDPIGRMPRLICVFSGRTLILLVLSCRGSHHHAHYSKQTQIDVLRLHCSTLNQTDRKFCRKRIIRQLGRDTEQGTLSLLYTLILNISLPRRLSKSWFGAHRFFFSA